MGDIVIADGGRPPRTLEQLASISDLVAIVRIGAVGTTIADDLVMSNFQGKVVEVFQSSRVMAPGYDVTVQMVGGEQSGERTVDANVTPLTPQTDYLLFLKYNDERGVYTPLHGKHAIFRIAEGRLRPHGNPEKGNAYEGDRNQTIERIRRRLMR